MRITPQHEQYGTPHKESHKLPAPAEVVDLLGGVGITPGTMSRRTSSFFEGED
jgi:hypothetical protein